MFEGTKVAKRKHNEHRRKEKETWNGTLEKQLRQRKLSYLTEDSKDIEIFAGL